MKDNAKRGPINLLALSTPIKNSRTTPIKAVGKREIKIPIRKKAIGRRIL